MCVSHTDATFSTRANYQNQPVSSYNDLKNVNQTDVRDNYDLSSVVLINCGASVPLPEIFL